MKHLFLFAVLILIFSSGQEALGRSYYNSASNRFGGLFPDPNMRMIGRYKAIVNDRLVEENASLATAITLDTVLIHSTTYRYQLRLANLNNKQGKTVSIKHPLTQAMEKITDTRWGLVFDYDEWGSYYAVVLSCDNSDPFNDITDRRTMRVTLINRSGFSDNELARTTLTKGVSLEDDLNTVCVDVGEHSVRVSIGKEELQPILEAEITRQPGAMQVGYLVGPGARVSLERAMMTIDGERHVPTKTQWTRESLDEYLATSSDPVEGYWKYLDRDMQDEWLRLGGRYTIAVVKADDGYDLIYIDGAQVKKSQWQTGMLKGHIVKTIFSGDYDARWIDATMEPIDKDVQATIENGVILTLNFPIYKSQVRFAKVLHLDD